MTLKDKNNILEDLIDASLRQLSKEYSKEQGEPHLFEYWSNTRATDKDKNICFQAVLDVRKMQPDGKVISFKRVYDRWLVQRPNLNFTKSIKILDEVEVEVETYNVDEPKYGKQLNMEEHRNTCLREVLGKSIASFAMGMALRSKEQIQDLYSDIDTESEEFKASHPTTPNDAFESIELTTADIEAYEKRELDSPETEGQTYSEAKD